MDNKNILTGKVTEIGQLEQIRRTSKPDIFKQILTIETSDGQKLFPEIRNNGIKILDREGIIEGVYVEIQYLFQGSEKSGKKYNNILINSIKRI